VPLLVEKPPVFHGSATLSLSDHEARLVVGPADNVLLVAIGRVHRLRHPASVDCAAGVQHSGVPALTALDGIL
jgi:hypothetical protein